MSHKATNWLSSLNAHEIGNAEFRVLFHLCDCHNPSKGCFPTQAYLLNACAVSNGTLNNALNSLEAKGFIQRHRERDGRTRRQKPTRYVLAFERGDAGDPSPKTGDGEKAEPCPKTGHGAKKSGENGSKTGGFSTKNADPCPKAGLSSGERASRSQKDAERLQITPEPSPNSGGGAVSKKRGDPTPKKGVTRLQPAGEVTCKEPVNNQSGARSGSYFSDQERSFAKEVADHIKGGGGVKPEAIPDKIRRCIIEQGFLDEERVRSHDILPAES